MPAILSSHRTGRLGQSLSNLTGAAEAIDARAAPIVYEIQCDARRHGRIRDIPPRDHVPNAIHGPESGVIAGVRRREELRLRLDGAAGIAGDETKHDRLAVHRLVI